MKQKVLVVGSFRSREFGVVGGIARSCEELMASEFSKRLDVITVDSTQRSNPPPNAIIRAEHSLVRLFVLVYKLVMLRPDCVLLFFSSGMSFYEKMLMGWISKLLGTKVCLFPRAGGLIESSLHNKLIGFLNRMLIRCGDVFLAQGPTWANFAISYCRFKQQNVHIVPNWTASDSYSTLGAERMLTLEAKAVPTIAFVGWLEVEKGVRELLQACKMLAESGLKFSCVLAGDGTQLDWINEFVTRHDLNGKVVLKGWLHGDELLEHYRNADIFVLPSWKEGMPNSLIEAMSSGLCPVVTSVGIIPDYVRNGEQGLLVEPHSYEALYEALRTLIQSPELQLECAQAAHASSMQFDKNRVIPLLCDIIENSLSK